METFEERLKVHIEALFGKEAKLPTLEDESCYDGIIKAIMEDIRLNSYWIDHYAGNTLRRTSDISACQKDAHEVIKHNERIVSKFKKLQNHDKEQLIRAANREIIENWVDKLFSEHKQAFIDNLTCYLIKHPS
tara:strand:- start:188 stop:586 length:399 start_codon:yes stop_codon:yes gene_type:complete